MCAAAAIRRGKNSRGAGPCQSVEAERDFDSDQQVTDALECLLRSAERQDPDWLHEAYPFGQGHTFAGVDCLGRYSTGYMTR